MNDLGYKLKGYSEIVAAISGDPMACEEALVVVSEGLSMIADELTKMDFENGAQATNSSAHEEVINEILKNA